jgi:hypothetical protein
MACNGKVLSVPTSEDDEDLVESSSLEWMNLEINVVHLFVDGSVPIEEDFAHLDFCPKDDVLQKPKDTDNHLKALWMEVQLST